MLEIITDPVFLWTIFGLAIAGLTFWIASFFIAPYIIYEVTLHRRSKKKWPREVPSELAPDMVQMYETGVAWSKENETHKKDVQIQRDGLHLYGEYYDFGQDKCVMILSGRTEALRYSYYFAIPYAKNGYNVLVIDPRAHGWSDGEFNTIGFEESLDDIAWVKFLQEECGVRSVIFHGICIGSAGGMYAMTHENRPDCLDGIIVEGMFANFGESMKNHLLERKKHPAEFIVRMIDWWMKKNTGHSMLKGPIDVIERLDKPLLMLHSQEDLYSTPEYAQKLYDLAGTKKKRLVWFEKGKHSMLRITDTQKYDEEITRFLQEML